VEQVNAAWTNLCGYSLDEAQGKSFSILQGKETNGKEAKKFVQNLHKDKFAETTLINYTKSGEAFPHCIAAQRLTNSRNGSDEGFYLTQSREAPVVAQSSAEHMVLKLIVIALVVAMVLGQLASQSTGESGRGRDESWFDMIDPNYGGSKHLDGFLYLGDERAFHAAFSSVHGSAPRI
jgi:hypothetical protein